MLSLVPAIAPENWIYLTAAQVAAMIRADLKAAFPAVKFSVRCSNYAGGSSVSVGWRDGPTVNAVESVYAYLDAQGFDGMQDIATNAGPFRAKDGRLCRCHSYISATRSHSPVFILDAITRTAAREGWTPDQTPRLGVSDYDGSGYVGRPVQAVQDYGCRWQEQIVYASLQDRTL